MFGHILAHIRVRTGRSVALGLGVLVATTGFIVLTASTSTARLTVIGTLHADSRAPYQILVRPAGARSDLEVQRGLIRPNFLGGQYGGISLAQWKQIQAISGVSVAAPIAMLGYMSVEVVATVDITDAIDPTLTRQILRIHPQYQADNGLTRATDDQAAYVYVTRRPVLWPDINDRGEVVPAFPGAKACPHSDVHHPPPYEVEPDGSRVALCLRTGGDESEADTRRGNGLRTVDAIEAVLPDGQFVYSGVRTDRAVVHLILPVLMLAAAIDPGQETALVGLDHAVVSGRNLTSADDVSRPATEPPSVPLLVATHSSIATQVSAAIQRLTMVDPRRLNSAALDQATSQSVVTTPVGSADDLYQQALGGAVPRAGRPGSTGQGAALLISNIDQTIHIGNPSYQTAPDATLRVQPQPPAIDVWPKVDRSFPSPPKLAEDSGARPVAAALLSSASTEKPFRGRWVGTFDAGAVTSSDPLTAVPLETYAAVTAGGADTRSRKLLGDKPLRPSDNIGGYLTGSPTILMPLAALSSVDPQDSVPISAVRVRVANVDGYTPVTLERVRFIAQQIHQRTGLDVDIALGSSPAAQTIALGPGRFGRPALLLAEPWSKLGVATAINHAIDRKSALLFALILIVCMIFLANAVAAAVADRRQQLAILACLGWTPGRLCLAIMGEAGLIGLAAGAVSTLLALPVSHATGIHLPLWRALLAIPVAAVLVLAAAAIPALQASRVHAASALWPSATKIRWASRRQRLLGSLAVANLRRTPGRSLLGVLALAMGSTALSMLLLVQQAFHGAVTGTLLGDAISVQVRAVDTAAVTTTLALAVFAVADVLYLNIRQRAGELALLSAIGWSNAALARLVGYEGLSIGVLGALIGAGAGLAATRAFAAPVASAQTLIVTALLSAGAGLALTAAAATLISLGLRRLPTAALLAEE